VYRRWRFGLAEPLRSCAVLNPVVRCGSVSTLSPMSKNLPDRATTKRGPYAVATGPDGTHQLSVELASLDGHTKRYSATWFGIEHDSESVILCFGQRIGKTLLSRLDVRFAELQFCGNIESIKDFITNTNQVGQRVEEAAWAVESLVPSSFKYLNEDATLMTLAWSGSQAEMTFYWVPSLDMHRAMNASKDVKYTGPQPVVTVCLTTGQLKWILTRSVELVGNLKEAR
jgi:hypothetical protein